MKNLLFLGALLLIGGCSSTRTVQKSSLSLDSTAVKTVQSFTETDQKNMVLVKNVSIVSDTVTTKADSASTSFFYNPADTSENFMLQVETGSLLTSVVYNKRTGKGLLTAHKKPESVPVNRYQEHTVLSESHGRSISGLVYIDSSHFVKTATGKSVVKETGNGWFIGFVVLVLLVAIVAFYIWFKEKIL